MVVKTTRVKIGVYGSYKKGFHNHDMLGNNATYVGTGRINGAMYLVDIGKNPYPLFYIESQNKTLIRDYLLELYEIDSDNYAKVQTKELKDSGMAITAMFGKDDYIIFVTDRDQKREPAAEDYVKAFNKLEFEAYTAGTFKVHALDQKRGEAQLQEILDDAAEVLEREKCQEASMIIRELIPYLYKPRDEKKESNIIVGQTKDIEEIMPSGNRSRLV